MSPDASLKNVAPSGFIEKITEVRPVLRDPAILRYVGPNLVELRVYPVESPAPRHVEWNSYIQKG